ncbi:MAG: SpoIIE family protein phosphatase [Hyphomicrobiales bacterium]|nr:SpoIIE family protein phosphatase [Hyphomicrobiales bacterium]
MRLNRLALKTLAVYIPLVLVAELVVFGFQSWRFHQESKAALLAELDNLMAVETKAFAGPVWEFDTGAIEILMAQIKELSLVESIALYDTNGALLSARGQIARPPAEPEFRRTGDVVFAQGGRRQVVGRLVLTVKDDHINAALAQYARFNGMILLTLFVALVGATSISTRLFVGRPLAKLRAAIEHARSGRARQKVDWNSRDEIGVVVRAYNDMQTYQESADRQIAEYQAHLEELVKARTAEIHASIEYASHIQRAVLPAPGAFESLFADHFVIWEPRDVVGGDIYWLRPWGGGWLLIMGDCTGHGVPGAFMTLIATGALEQAQMTVPVGDLGALVQRMHGLIRAALMQDPNGVRSRDGMELGACFFDGSDGGFLFCGARFSLFVAGENGVEEIRGARQGIGFARVPPDRTFETVRVPITARTRYYMTTDGLPDQFGGPHRRSFGKRRFVRTLARTADRPLPDQARELTARLADHQGTAPRVDDIAVVGFRF